jgi:hypothetical protein
MIDELLAEIDELKRAKELLNKVYVEHGPYRDEQITEKTWSEVCRFFHFDDSE